MSRVKKYDVVEASSIGLLVYEVQQRISSGWQPLSGPFYLNGSHFQAVVWTDEAEGRSQERPGIRRDHRNRYESEIELIEELTEDDQPISRWETALDDTRDGTGG